MFSTATEKTYSGHLKTKGVVSSLDGKLGLGLLDIATNASPSQIKIITSIPADQGNSDFTVNIKGFVYNSQEVCDLTICWHWYLNAFWNPACISNGSWHPTKIELSEENNRVCIVLSGGPSYWPKMYVESAYSSFYEDKYWHDWSWDMGIASGNPITNVPIRRNSVEMLQATLTSSASATIVANNAGTVTLSGEHQTDTDYLAVESNKIVCKRKGHVFVTANQDVIATNTGGGYVQLLTNRERGGVDSTQHQQLAAPQGTQKWTAIHSACSFDVEAGDFIKFYMSSSEDILSLDYSTWSAYNVIWRPL